MMDRCRDLIELYATRLGDDITGPMLIGIVFAIGMMVFTGLNVCDYHVGDPVRALVRAKANLETRNHQARS